MSRDMAQEIMRGLYLGFEERLAAGQLCIQVVEGHQPYRFQRQTIKA